MTVRNKPDLSVPNAATAWQLWYRDTFDRDAPPSLEARGTDIVHGLHALWFSTLKEAILENGSASFSRFHLTWGDAPAMRVEIVVNPFDNLALLKVRRWVGFAEPSPTREGLPTGQHLEEQRETVLGRLAQAHYDLLQKSRRWTAPSIDWGAEARELLERVESISNSEEL